MLSARFCKRRDCSTFRDVVDGIKCSRQKKEINLGDGLLYQRRHAEINPIFTILPSPRKIAQIS
jgi:hypothetical protein